MGQAYTRATLLTEASKFAALRTRLADMLRASDETQEYFVEPQDGVLAQMLARRHHFVFGRRGSGKSSLLLQARSDALKAGRVVAMANLGKFGHQSLSQVILETFQAILRDIRRALARRGSHSFDQQISDTLQKIERLLQEPETHEEVEIESDGSSEATEGRAGLDIKIVSARAKDSIGKTRTTERKKTFKEQKLERVNRVVGTFEDLLAQIAEESGGIYVILDDLYYLSPDQQPHFLHYLASVCSGHPIWLKIGSVKQRTLTYTIDEGRPVGMDLTNDASEINLDSSLEHYAVTKSFLEKLLNAAIQPFGILEKNLIAPNALNRMIQASGGVARDFLTILDQSIGEARDRMLRQRQIGEGDEENAIHQRIISDDIWKACANLNEKKKAALRGEGGEQHAAVFETLRWVTNFVTQEDRVNGILLEGPDSFWAHPGLVKLWEFKLLHIIQQSKRLSHKDYAVVMLDVGELALNQSNWRRAADLLKFREKFERPMQIAAGLP